MLNYHRHEAEIQYNIPESQSLKQNGKFSKNLCVTVSISENIKLFNMLLSNFLSSLQIRIDPTSDIGTLSPTKCLTYIYFVFKAV